MEILYILITASLGAVLYFLLIKVRENKEVIQSKLDDLKESLEEKKSDTSSSTIIEEVVDTSPNVEVSFIEICEKAKKYCSSPEKLDRIVAKYSKQTAPLVEKSEKLELEYEVLEKELNLDVTDKRYESILNKQDKVREKIDEIEEKIEEIEEELSEVDLGLLRIKPELSLGVPKSVLKDYGKLLIEIPKEKQVIYQKYLDHCLEEVELRDFEYEFQPEKNEYLKKILRAITMIEEGKTKDAGNLLKGYRGQSAREKSVTSETIIEVYDLDRVAFITGLPNNVLNILKENNVKNLNGLKSLELAEISKVKGIGRVGLDAIKKAQFFLKDESARYLIE